MTEDLFIESAPTLLYPVGGESLTHETIQIEWEPSANVDWEPSGGNSGFISWYEILFSIDTANEDNRTWRTIAYAPIDKTVFDWAIPNGIRSDLCRIGIREVYSTGHKGSISMSHSAFSVQNKILPSPAVISPIDGDIFFSYISIVFDQGGLAGQFPKRAHYRVSYSADSQETDWICIGDDIPVTTSESYLDVSSLPSSNDYSLKLTSFNTFYL